MSVIINNTNRIVRRICELYVEYVIVLNEWGLSVVSNEIVQGLVYVVRLGETKTSLSPIDFAMQHGIIGSVIEKPKTHFEKSYDAETITMMTNTSKHKYWNEKKSFEHDSHRVFKTIVSIVNVTQIADQWSFF